MSRVSRTVAPFLYSLVPFTLTHFPLRLKLNFFLSEQKVISVFYLN